MLRDKNFVQLKFNCPKLITWLFVVSIWWLWRPSSEDSWDARLLGHAYLQITLRMVSHYFLTLFRRLPTKTQVKEFTSEAKYTVFFFSDRHDDDYCPLLWLFLSRMYNSYEDFKDDIDPHPASGIWTTVKCIQQFMDHVWHYKYYYLVWFVCTCILF